MTRRRDDCVVTVRFQFRNGHAVDQPVRDHRSDVVLRMRAPRRGELREVRLEVAHNIENVFGLKRAAHVRVAGAEQFLRELEHDRLIAFGHTENRHDHAQRIPNRHVLDEVAFAAEVGHPVDVLLRQRIDPALQLAQVRPHEPRLREHAVLGVIRIVHLHQRADEVAPAEHLLHHPSDRRRPQGRARVVDETGLVQLDVFDISVFRDRPERLETLGRQPPDRIVGAQPAQITVNALLIAPDNRVDQLTIQFGGVRNVHDSLDGPMSGRAGAGQIEALTRVSSCHGNQKARDDRGTQWRAVRRPRSGHRE